MINKIKNFIFNLPALIIIALISLYQFLLSPDHSWLKVRFPHGYCRFYPSCSEYAKESVTRFGLLKGARLAIVRLIKCHPWSEPKVDLVPKF
jgi:putative membrane protein insertion efficiency factor